MTPEPDAKPVVLVVDDEAILIMHAVDILQEAGFDTVEARNAQDAIYQLGQHPEVSILFTDINMPGDLDGLELAHQVHRQRPDIHIVLTSGRVGAPLEVPGKGHFVSKPYDTQTLTQILQTLAG